MGGQIMFRNLTPLVLFGVSASSSLGQTIELHELGNLGGDMWGVDVAVYMEYSGPWLAGAVTGHALLGATFVYGIDPNSGDPVYTAPEQFGVGRGVTFVSYPRGQFVNERFGADGAVSVVFGYDPPDPNPTMNYYDLNIAYAEIPPTLTQGDGFTQRIVIDTSQCAYAGASMYAGFVPRDPEDVPIAQLESTAIGRTSDPPWWDYRWFFFAVPEPSALLLLSLMFGFAACRRQTERSQTVSRRSNPPPPSHP